jgi:hypothetical protein
MTRRTVATALVVAVVIGGLVPRMATAQWGRPGWRMGLEQGGALAPQYGYRGPAYQAPPPGGYAAPAGYATPPGGYGAAPPGQGYPPPGYGSPGYPAPSYAPPAYQPPYAYPQQGQNPQQATSDQSECGSWASQQTGFNPTAPAGSWAGGSVAGTGGPVGLFGGIQRREERREFRRERWEGQTAADFRQDGYGRALDACLSARGYAVR